MLNAKAFDAGAAIRPVKAVRIIGMEIEVIYVRNYQFFDVSHLA